MKRTVLRKSFLAFLLLFISAITYTYNSYPPLEMTGAPGETDCQSCHNVNATTVSPSTLVSLNGLPTSGYTAGTTYTLTLDGSSAAFTVRNGFEITCLDVTNNNKAGSFDPISSSNDCDTISSSGKQYIFHTSSLHTGWTFNWTAPASGTGAVKFYISFNATDNSGSNDGDTYHHVEIVVNEAGVSIPKDTLTFRAFFQGYYKGAQSMNAVLQGSGVNAPLSVCDSVHVQLADFSTLQVNLDTTILIGVDGYATVLFPALFTGNQYLVLKNRTHVETWSNNPIYMSSNIFYDFSTSANQAYGDNMIDDGNGTFMIYAGDINNDGVVSNDDMVITDNENSAFASGYIDGDINGDGIVSNDDIVLLDNNNSNFVALIRP